MRLRLGEPAHSPTLSRTLRTESINLGKVASALYNALFGIDKLATGLIASAAYDKARVHIGKDESTAISWLAVTIDAWNRIAIASCYRVAS